MDLIKRLTEQARQNPKRIVLPESNDTRVLQAAVQLDSKKLAQITLLGNPDEVNQSLNDISDNATHQINIIDPLDFPQKQDYANTLYQLRQHKGMSETEALALIDQPMVVASLMLQRNDVDGCVAGAHYASADVLRAALQIVGVKKDTKLVSSFFLMLFNQEWHPFQGEMLFADCAMNIEPEADALVEIAKASIENAKTFLSEKPKVAFLSFSTNGSGRHALVDKVSEATQKASTILPDIDIIGEIQLDAALNQAIMDKKYPDSNFQAPANILIFPSLEAGNIGYKLVQQFSGAQATGPVLQGLNKPVNDLSRGCSVEEIVNTVIITSNQS